MLNAFVIHPQTDVLAALATRLVAIADSIIPDRPFHPYQHEFALAVVTAVITQSSEELTALFARQSGKTETMARVAVTLAVFLPYLAKQLPEQLKTFTKGVWIGVFAPVKDQATTSFERMVEALENKRSMSIVRKMNLAIKEKNKSSRLLTNGSFIRTWSASQGSNIESKTLHLAIVEEAQDVGAYKIRKSIEPMLTSTAGTLVQIGTANGLKSLFYESIERNRKTQHREGTRLHFQYDWKTIVQNSPNYRSFLNGKIRQRGRGWVETDEFRMAYGCEFILERGQFMSFTRLQALEGIAKDLKLKRGPFDKYGKCTLKVRVVAGIDWGKSSDSTVVTILAKFSDFVCVVDWLELVGDDYDSQYDSIVRYLARFPTLEIVLAESNGVGDSMVDRIKKAASTGHIRAEVSGFVASASSNSEGYKNLMTDMVNANRLLIPEDDKSREYEKFAEQITDAVKDWRGSILRVKAPESQNKSTRTEGDKHDDFVSSLMIAYWAASRMSTSQMFEQFFNEGKLANGNPKKNIAR